MAMLIGMLGPSQYQALIERALPGARVRVEDQGGGDHLFAEIVAPQFTGLSRLEQHRLVYAALKPHMDDGSIHALGLHTRAPEEA